MSKNSDVAGGNEVAEAAETSESQKGKSEVDEKVSGKYEDSLKDDSSQDFEYKSAEEKDAEHEIDARNTPIEGHGGHWGGDRGDSTWYPNRDETPKKYNPDNKTWDEILDENKIDGVEFQDGEPNFTEASLATVEIDDFTEDRSDNFDQADEELSEQWDCEPGDVAAFRKSDKYTWHECKDCETMEMVPSELHNNIPHRGGVARAKEGFDEDE